MPIPRTLILTAWHASGRYAGAEAMRRVLSGLPAARIRWASLDDESVCEVMGVETKGFPRRLAHWRLHEGAADFFFRDHVDARRLARRIAAWVKEFEPEALWVLPELQAIPVALHLQRMLRIPIHATVYDAPENALFVCVPKAYSAIHMRLVRKLYARVSSVDVISKELGDYLRETCVPASANMTVLPASVSETWFARSEGPDFKSKVRRIAFCGAMRTPIPQWATFMRQLSRLPYQFEIVAYAADESFADLAVPHNVQIKMMPYVESERELIRSMAASGACCGYVGLPREGLGEHFARTSLSSKLTSYAAAGLPILIDGSEESAAWQMVQEHGAGVRVIEDAAPFEVLCSNQTHWEALAAASRQMAEAVFCLERNVPALEAQLRATVGGDLGQ